MYVEIWGKVSGNRTRLFVMKNRYLIVYVFAHHVENRVSGRPEDCCTHKHK